MGRKKLDEVIKINRISDELKRLKISNFLISIWTGVHIKTVSYWRSNNIQPSEENLNQLGELFERENALLKVAGQTRRNTGLAKALDQELKRLMKIEKIPFEVDKDPETKKGDNNSDRDSVEDEASKKTPTKIINPLLVKKIKAFAEEYKKHNPPAPLTYFDKPLSKITKEELKGLELFICNSEKNPGSDKLRYQVISIVKDVIQVVANFAKITDAKSYVDLIQRGYIELS
ncbi:MAG: hypothetical protein K0R59_1222 [Sphingobacterium sp.]|jgi:hypothetical protein|nr:hypothetical protein [Sphingobacterium sp.]